MSHPLEKFKNPHFLSYEGCMGGCKILPDCNFIKLYHDRGECHLYDSPMKQCSSSIGLSTKAKAACG